jgi:tetratricopeptide (TPR) repeat protein
MVLPMASSPSGPTDLPDIPLGLRQALEAGECVLFLGAGIGWHLWRDGVHAPVGTALAKELADNFRIDAGPSPSLAKVSQVVEIRKGGRTELETFLKKRLCGLQPDDALRWICSVRWKAIYTTNYDDGIELAYGQAATPPQTPVPIASTSELTAFDRRFQVPIYYLHGKLCGPDKPRIVITESDYAEFRKQRQMMFEVLKVEFATSTFLYIGYSNEDPNWKMVLDELRSEFFPSQLPPSFRVAPSTDALDEEILRSKNIETIAATFDAFQRSAAVALAGTKVPADALSRIQASIPTELLEAFDRNPAAVARLLNSWEYVNQVPFGSAPNVRDFFRGDRANWGLIGKKVAFERDLEEEVYETLLDYVTSSAKRPSIFVVLSPAGYGTTTFLRTLAARLVYDRAGTVLMHKEAMPLMLGDTEFATSIFPSQCPIFLIDNAADYAAAAYEAVQRLRDESKPAIFLFGERLNEWRYARGGRTSGNEFVIDPLSDPEIARLLTSLETHNELNKLKDLSPELRVAAIKQNYQQELLVTLREATEGRAFDAILEDEFRSIPSDLGRRLYLVVCCFYQHGALIRDTLLADMLHVSVTEMYSETSAATAGVVHFEEIDPSYGHHAARARHRKIAAVVWERCAEPGDRETIIIDALSKMNLTYRADLKAFEDFIRSDRLIDSIRTLDSRIRFFEEACRKEPISPYVRQHYARMLARAEKFTLALSQIDEGLKINPSIRVLHHTKGLILHQLAMTTESQEIARRRLVQSEDEFRRCITDNDRDEYAYQGLATLFVDWAQRMDDTAETANYLARAEAVIAEGLRRVRAREGLWIVSSRIQEILGNTPKYMDALTRAATEAPGGVVAKYLLGRAYRRAGNPKKAIEVLQPLIEAHTDEFRACTECALAMDEIGEPYSKCIALIRLGTLYGLSDPRFVSTLAGMLFLNSEFSEAQAIFKQTQRREFPAPEASRIEFRPRDRSDPTKPMRLTGTIATVKSGYAFIDVPGYPSFFCPGSKFGAVVMRRGLKVEFEPAFNAKGAIADSINLAA